jgi:hypothetical protein
MNDKMKSEGLMSFFGNGDSEHEGRRYFATHGSAEAPQARAVLISAQPKC